LKVQPKIHCYLAGESSDDTIKKRIADLQKDFPANFHYKDAYNLSDIPELTKSAQVFLFPSSYTNEAAPLVVYEAQLMGLVCLTTNVGSLPTVVKEPGVTFRYSDWEDGVLEYLMKLHLLTEHERYRFFQGARKEVGRSTYEDSAQGIHEMKRICGEIMNTEMRR
jgi:glycosyltransferase involved in cell wall biosynthesis